ncbi:MAG: hypothetical protein Ct9H300mP32_4610 [Verrucomicrobiota bacterium]|nr:MAG: hypothetical protein Ct9H300mP32_4610 [Verrucomicrobiota bacterium]
MKGKDTGEVGSAETGDSDEAFDMKRSIACSPTRHKTRSKIKAPPRPSHRQRAKIPARSTLGKQNLLRKRGE